MRQGLRIFFLRFEGFTDPILVIEIVRIESGGILQMGDTLRGILRQPVRNAQMVLRGCVPRFQLQRTLEALDRLVASVQDSQQKTDFVFEAGRLRVQGSRLLIDCQCGSGVAPRLQRCAAGFQIRDRVIGLADHPERQE